MEAPSVDVPRRDSEKKKASVARWSVEEVVSWLTENGMEDLDEKFVAFKVDGTQLLALNEEKFNVMKIRSTSFRRSILDFVSSSRPCSPVPTPHEEEEDIKGHQHASEKGDETASSPSLSALSKLQGRLETLLKSKEGGLTTLVGDLSTLTSSSETTSGEIEALFLHLHDLLDKKKDELLKDVKKIHQECATPLVESKTRGEKEVHEVRELLSLVAKASSTAMGSHADIHESGNENSVKTQSVSQSHGESIEDTVTVLTERVARVEQSSLLVGPTAQRYKINIEFDGQRMTALQDNLKTIGSVVLQGV
jgi:hypothetical protein